MISQWLGHLDKHANAILLDGFAFHDQEKLSKLGREERPDVQWLKKNRFEAAALVRGAVRRFLE